MNSIDDKTYEEIIISRQRERDTHTHAYMCVLLPTSAFTSQEMCNGSPFFH